MSTAFGTRAAAVESPFQVTRNADLGSIEATKAGLVGSYVVTGTDSDGKSYLGSHILDVSMAPSGALELDWDNGKQVGVGQVIGNVLAVACLIKGRTVILTMARREATRLLRDHEYRGLCLSQRHRLGPRQEGGTAATAQLLLA